MSNEKNARKTLVKYCRKLYDKGYVPGVDGNISIRVDESTILITPSGVSKEILTEQDLVLMNLSGETIGENNKPSVEAPMHLAAFKNSAGVGAVIHAHSPNTSAFAFARKNIDTRHSPHSYYHLGIVGYVPFFLPGRDELHEVVADFIKKGSKILLLENHGAMVLGKDMQSAFEKTDLLEAYADMLIKASLLGGSQMLSDEQISEIQAG